MDPDDFIKMILHGIMIMKKREHDAVADNCVQDKVVNRLKDGTSKS